MTTKTATSVLVYWDSQDPTNEGWAYRVSADHGDIASGSMDDLGGCGDLPTDADGSALQDAVVSVAHQHDIEITADDVVCEPNVDGGYARWDA